MIKTEHKLKTFQIPGSIPKDGVLFVRYDGEEKNIMLYVGDVQLVLEGPIVPLVKITKGFKKMVIG